MAFSRSAISKSRCQLGSTNSGSLGYRPQYCMRSLRMCEVCRSCFADFPSTWIGSFDCATVPIFGSLGRSNVAVLSERSLRRKQSVDVSASRFCAAYLNSSIVDPADRTHNAVPTRKRVRRMASRARSDAKHVPQKKTCFRHRVQRRFRSFGIGQLCGDAEDVRETLSMSGKVQEQFIGASDCLGRGRNVRLSAWGERL